MTRKRLAVHLEDLMANRAPPMEWYAGLAGAQAAHATSSTRGSRTFVRKRMPWYQYMNTSVAVSHGVPNHASREDTGIVLVDISTRMRVLPLSPQFWWCSQLMLKP